MLKRISILLFTLFLAFTISSCGQTTHNNPPPSCSSLKITFIDVGQGDAALLQTGSCAMLIDAGTNESTGKVVSTLKKGGVSRVDVLIGTHPHEDHIGGMDAVVRQFEIGKIYMPMVTANTKTFKDVVKAVKEKGLGISTPAAGTRFQLGEAECTILAPNGGKYKDLNNYSIVLKVVFGKTSFLFTGDAETLSEEEILARGYDISADVLKIGHHGYLYKSIV